MKNIEIVVLENEELLKFNALFYDELLLELPDDALMLGAIETGGEVPEAVGLLIFHIRDTAVYVDWFCVDDEHRERGVGKALMDYLKNVLITAEDADIEVVFVNFNETVRGLGRFLRENGFAVTFFDGNFNIYAPLNRVRLMKPDHSNEKLKALPLDQVPEKSYKLFDDYIDMVENAYEGIIGPIDPDDYRPESRAILSGDRIVGIMLVGSTIYDKNVMIDWVYSMPKFVLQAVPLAFDTVVTELKKSMPEDSMISMASLSPNVGSIIRKTMPGAVFAESYSAFWLVER